MLVTDNKRDFYDVILQDRGHVLVLVSYDLDSILAVKILRHIFECDHIQHSILPVKDKAELHRTFQQHRERLKHVILINCGGTFDCLEFFIPEPDVKIFIADCRRPLDIHNVYYDTNIYMLTAISGLNNIENEFEKIPKYEDVFWDDEVHDDDVDVQSLSLEQLNKRRAFKKFEANRFNVLYDYEEYSYYTFSTALMFFDLAWTLGKDNNDLLWYCILSTVDKSDSFKVQNDKYQKEINYLHEAMLRLKNIHSDNRIVINRAHNRFVDGEGSGAQGDNDQITIATNHLGLTYEKDLNLKMYREWSLYESLRHTMFIACRFKIFKVQGITKLHRFLADLGLPLIECKHKFDNMDLTLRKNLIEEMEEKAEKYGLKQLICNSFIAIRSGFLRCKAEDIAAGARSLLESANNQRTGRQKFFDAFDSLELSKRKVLTAGIDQAKIQLAAILKQVQLILDGNFTSLMNDVLLYVIIPEGVPDEMLFCHPSRLRALATFTLNAYASFYSKNNRNCRLPLIMMTHDPDTPGRAIVCGLPPLLALKDCRTFLKHAFSLMSKNMMKKVENWSYEESLIDHDIVYIPWEHRMAFLHEFADMLKSS